MRGVCALFVEHQLVRKFIFLVRLSISGLKKIANLSDPHFLSISYRLVFSFFNGFHLKAYGYRA